MAAFNASASATAAIASVRKSASAAIAGVQSSASVGVLAANSALSQAQALASSAIANESCAVKNAKGKSFSFPFTLPSLPIPSLLSLPPSQ